MNHRLFLILLFLVSLVFSLLGAEEVQAKTHSKKPEKQNSLVPFETKMDLGFLGILGSSMSYTLNGRKITRYKEFKDIIYASGDVEASDLIRQASEADTVSWIFFAIGIPTGLDVCLAFRPVHVFGVDWMDRIISGVAAAEVPIGIGFLFSSNAEGLKYNAVQRYNHLVNVQEKVELDVGPRLFAAGDHWDLGLGTKF